MKFHNTFQSHSFLMLCPSFVFFFFFFLAYLGHFMRSRVVINLQKQKIMKMVVIIKKVTKEKPNCTQLGGGRTLLLSMSSRFVVGQILFPVIRDLTSAKIAWETLASKFKPQLVRTKTMVGSESPTNEVTISSDEFNLAESFYNAVWIGDWHATNEFIGRDPKVVRARITYSGRTAFHVAAINGI
nr:uncharacterized protein LOC125421278 [Ziziphus jujuba var. spinosa]